MSRPPGDRAIRAVFVPAGGEALGVARLEVAAAAAQGAWMLSLYLTGSHPPRRTPLTAEEVRDLVRQWRWAVQQGRGTVRLG